MSKGNIAESACLCKRTEFYQDENKECVPCPAGADCTLRDGLQLSELSALPNHWRSSANSKKFPECKKYTNRCCPLMKEDNTTSICSGINLTNGTDGQCLSGYSGPLCYACAENYVKKGSECVYCSAEVNIGAVLGVYLGLCVILFVIVFIVIRKTTTLRKEGEKGYSGPDAVDFYMDLTTIMISFLQVLSAVTTTYSSVDWPESFRTTSEPFGVVNLDVSFVLPLADCSLSLDYGTKLLLHIFTPVAIVISIKLAEFAAISRANCHSRKNPEPKKKKKERMSAQKGLGDRIAITLVFLVYPSMTTRIMQMWRCDDIEGVLYLETDYNEVCDSSINGKYGAYRSISVVMIILFGIGIPLTLLIELWRNIAHLYDSEHDKFYITQFRLGPFFQSFKPRFWWFEVIIIVYKAILVGVLSVVAPHTPLQLFFALLICIAYMLLVLKAAPYITQNLDTLSFLCSLSLSSTMLIGALKSTNDSAFASGAAYNLNGLGLSKEKEGIGNISYELLGPMLITMNALPFVYLIYTIIDRQSVRRKETAEIVRSKTQMQSKKNHRYSVIRPTHVMPLPEAAPEAAPELASAVHNNPDQIPRSESGAETPEQKPRQECVTPELEQKLKDEMQASSLKDWN